MELSQLEYFKVAARHSSFTQAAEALHITQPALSKSVSRLEKELGAALFDRGGGPLQLTSAGRAFLVWCNRALSAIDSGVREVGDMNGAVTGSVRVAVSEAVYINHLSRDFLKANPNVSIECHLLTHNQMRTALHEGTVDFTVSRGPLFGPDISWRPVYEENLAVLMSSEHALAKKRSLRLEELAHEFFLMGDLSNDMTSFVYDLCYQAGFTPTIRYEGHESDVAGMMSVLPDSVMLVYSSTTHGVKVSAPALTNLIAVPVEDDIRLEPIGMGFRSNCYRSRAVQAFYEMVSGYYRTLPKGSPA